MAIAPKSTIDRVAEYVGARMSADEFLNIDDDGQFYELIDGVVIMSPSPTPEHQQAMMEIARQLANHCATSKVGRVFPEQDVHLGKSTSGDDIVYRPELVFIRTDRLGEMRKKIVGAPDVVVEVISRGSRRLDTETKFRDYERFGVLEYWLIDPQRDSMMFYRLQEGVFVEVKPEQDEYSSDTVAGFRLNLQDVRDAYGDW
jgi:Uma2 family endonuclease